MKTPNLKKIIPPPTSVLREGLIVLGGVLLAAWVISRFPKLKAFVSGASITVNDGNGNNYYS
jgi:hypothetical protein